MEQVVFDERVILDASASQPFEIFAQLQALMCFPRERSTGRDRIASAICGDLLDQQCELEPEIASTLRASFPHYMKSRNRVSLATHGRRWGEAFIAGKYFLVRLKHTVTGEHPTVDGSTKKLSGRAAVKAMFPAREEGFEIDYESRVHDIEKHSIRAFYPIAHLAAAFQCAAHIASPETYAGEFQIHNIAFHRALVNLAGGYAECIRATPELGSVATQLITLEWRD